MKLFTGPGRSLGDLDPEAAGRLLAAAADLALVVDAGGVVRDLAIGEAEELPRACCESWLGVAWADTVAPGSRDEVAALLDEAGARGQSARPRRVVHLGFDGQEFPHRYVAVRVAGDGRILASGRALRASTALEQRLADVQQSIDRDYAQLRQFESRYRALFELVTEAVVIVDGATGKVQAANPAAERWLGVAPGRLPGSRLAACLAPATGRALEPVLRSVQESGRPDSLPGRLAHEPGPVELAVSPCGWKGAAACLVRVASRSDAAPSDSPSTPGQDALLRAVAAGPDAFAATDADGRILWVNGAFLALAELREEAHARGESLGRWLGRPGPGVGMLLAYLREHGSVRLFTTAFEGERGAAADVEIAGVSVARSGRTVLGFALRRLGRAAAKGGAGRRPLPPSVEHLTQLVGRVPLKDVVRDATELIEQLCIESALELTGGNRASAAGMLGLSRQSLHAKLRRYGLGDTGGRN